MRTDPNFAASCVTPLHVRQLVQHIPALTTHNLESNLLQELPTYLSLAASAPTFDRSDLPLYTAALLTWWRQN